MSACCDVLMNSCNIDHATNSSVSLNLLRYSDMFLGKSSSASFPSALLGLRSALSYMRNPTTFPAPSAVPRFFRTCNGSRNNLACCMQRLYAEPMDLSWSAIVVLVGTSKPGISAAAANTFSHVSIPSAPTKWGTPRGTVDG